MPVSVGWRSAGRTARYPHRRQFGADTSDIQANEESHLRSPQMVPTAWYRNAVMGK
jgi:hypothetical protein